LINSVWTCTVLFTALRSATTSKFCPNYASEEGHEQTTNVLLFQFTIGHVTRRPAYVWLLPATWILPKKY